MLGLHEGSDAWGSMRTQTLGFGDLGSVSIWCFYPAPALSLSCFELLSSTPRGVKCSWLFQAGEAHAGVSWAKEGAGPMSTLSVISRLRFLQAWGLYGQIVLKPPPLPAALPSDP